MNSKELFMVLHGNFGGCANVSSADFSRELVLCINRRAGNPNLIASISGEFLYKHTQYPFNLTFDENGHTNPSRLTMLMSKVTNTKRMVAFMSIVEYLQDNGHMQHDMSASIIVHITKDRGESVVHRYERYKRVAAEYIKHVEATEARASMARDGRAAAAAAR